MPAPTIAISRCALVIARRIPEPSAPRQTGSGDSSSGRVRGRRHLRTTPTTTQRLVEAHRRLQAVEPDLRELILRGEERALGIEDREQIVGARTVAHFGQPQRLAGARLHVVLQLLLLTLARGR